MLATNDIIALIASLVELVRNPVAPAIARLASNYVPVTIIFAICTWIVRVLVYLYLDFKSTRGMILGVHTELRMNVDGLKELDFSGSDWTDLLVHVGNGGAILMTSQHDRVFYSAHCTNITRLKPELMKRIVEFYSYMDTVDADVASMGLPGFSAISSAGRQAVLKRIAQTTLLAIDVGERALADFKTHYGLKREAEEQDPEHSAPSPDTKAEQS